jgi:5-dehydro-2-deoxygluconokinase
MSGEPSAGRSTHVGLDLVCVGRAAVDLYGEERGVSLRHAVRFRRSLGGAAANAAVGAARLGLRTGILTRVGADELGAFVFEALKREGIDLSWVRRDPDRLTGLVVLAMASASEFPHLFYRNDCADMALDVPEGARVYVETAGALLLTGTHLSTPATLELSARMAEWARGRVVLDLDYRPSLWGAVPVGEGQARSQPSVRARAAYRRILPSCDVVVGTEEEFAVAAGTADLGDGLSRLNSLSSARLVVKRGPRGAFSIDVDGGQVEVDGIGVPVLNLLGAGDAFVSAYVAASLQDRSPLECLRWANAAGALVVGRHGCAPATPTRDELMRFLDEVGHPAAEGAVASAIRHADARHRAVRPQRRRSPLAVLALDHRAFFLDLVRAHGRAEADIPRLKALILRAGQRAFDDLGLPAEQTGFIIDDQYGADLLASAERAAASGPHRWVARPIEEATGPFRWLGDRAAAGILATWPAHHAVKCKVSLHPNDPAPVRADKERRLRELADACTALDRPLLLELLPRDAAGEEDLAALPQLVSSLLDDGIRPDLWKLPPLSTPEAWRELARVLDAQDPHGGGVLLLGNGCTREEVEARLAVARGAEACRGIAFGRTVFADAAQAWMAGDDDDDAFHDRVMQRWQHLLRCWQAAVGG